MIPIEEYYYDLKKVMLNKEQYLKLYNGVKLDMEDQDKLVRVYCMNKYKGLGQIKSKKLSRYIIEEA